MNKKGFTLIELLVAVAIVMVLGVLAMVNYGGAQKKARDGRRLSDLEKIRVALELYRQALGTYPENRDDLKPNYLQDWPSDPKAGYTYDYNRPTAYTYTAKAQMEDLGSTNMPAESGCGGSCNYKVNNP
jgi:prepilin-type N-terminal cleavage/methylation domain-containing protein